jgi:ribosomal protein L29
LTQQEKEMYDALVELKDAVFSVRQAISQEDLEKIPELRRYRLDLALNTVYKIMKLTETDNVR